MTNAALIHRRQRIMARIVLAAVATMSTTGDPVAAQSPQQRSAEAMVRTANAAYIEALEQHQRLLAEDAAEGLPPEDLRALVDTTDRILWAAAAMASMCAAARSLRQVLAETRCEQIEADVARLEGQRAELRALLDN